MTVQGVRRAKAAFLSEFKSHSATFSPAGSNRSSHSIIYGFAYYKTGQYQKAIDVLKPIDKDWADKQRWLATSYANLGDIQKASVEPPKLLQIEPNASLQLYAKTLPYSGKEDLERELSDLRKAGLI